MAKKKKNSSQQSYRCKSNMVKKALIDSSVSTHGDISIAYRNKLTGSLWTIFFVRASKHDVFESARAEVQIILCSSQT